jgi:hypothetical protein
MGRYQYLLEKRFAEVKDIREGCPAWDVKCCWAPTSYDMVSSILDNGGFLNEADLYLRFPNLDDLFRAYLDAPYTHEVACDSMRSSVVDGDWAMMCRPEFEDKYKIKISKPLRIKYAFVGRSGGWIIPEWFEGVSMAALQQGDRFSLSTTFCKQLLAMWDEWDEMFSRRAVYEEFVHHLAFRFCVDVLEREEAA